MGGQMGGQNGRAEWAGRMDKRIDRDQTKLTNGETKQTGRTEQTGTGRMGGRAERRTKQTERRNGQNGRSGRMGGRMGRRMGGRMGGRSGRKGKQSGRKGKQSGRKGKQSGRTAETPHRHSEDSQNAGLNHAAGEEKTTIRPGETGRERKPGADRTGADQPKRRYGISGRLFRYVRRH